MFPEILNTILGYVLVLETDEKLRPRINTSNLRILCLSGYETHRELDLAEHWPETRGPFMSWTEVQDAPGSYTELRHLYRKPIDATLIRVNNYFGRIVRSMLYGGNVFSFDMTPKGWKRLPACCRTVGNCNFLHEVSPMKPSWREVALGGAITKGIDTNRQGERVYKLPGWLYHDRFCYSCTPSVPRTLRTSDP